MLLLLPVAELSHHHSSSLLHPTVWAASHLNRVWQNIDPVVTLSSHTFFFIPLFSSSISLLPSPSSPCLFHSVFILLCFYLHPFVSSHPSFLLPLHQPLPHSAFFYISLASLSSLILSSLHPRPAQLHILITARAAYWNFQRRASGEKLTCE